MSEHVEHDPTLNPHARGHQQDLIDIRTILAFTVALVGVVAAIFIFIAVVMVGWFYSKEDRLAELRPALFDENDPSLYPGARLQESPGRDMERMRQGVGEQLDSYGWVDREHGVAHIPIDRAIDLVLRDGLPGPDDAAPAGTAVSVPADDVTSTPAAAPADDVTSAPADDATPVSSAGEEDGVE